MRAERHEGNGLQYITVVPDGYTPDSSYPLVVMLHGFGANMQDLAGLAPTINADGYVYACPNAPIPARPRPIGFRMDDTPGRRTSRGNRQLRTAPQ